MRSCLPYLYTRIDVYRDSDVDVEDVDLEEFADEIESWILDELKGVGCDTAKSVIEIGKEELVKRDRDKTDKTDKKHTQTHRQTDRHTDRQAHRHTDGQADSQPVRPFMGKDGLTRKFIPASLQDNPYLAKDGRYEQMLKALPPTQRRQLLDGDWDVAEGAAFTEFSRLDHVITPFEIPVHWERIKGIDYGYASESACVWGAVVSLATTTDPAN